MACNSAISVDVRDTSVFQFDSFPLGFGLACLIDLPAISELDSWFFCKLFVLVVGVAAIEKRTHDSVIRSKLRSPFHGLSCTALHPRMK